MSEDVQLGSRSLEQDRERLQRLYQGAADEAQRLRDDAATHEGLQQDAVELRGQAARECTSLQVSPTSGPRRPLNTYSQPASGRAQIHQQKGESLQPCPPRVGGSGWTTRST